MTLIEFATLLETTDKKQGFGFLISMDKSECCALGLAANKIYPELDMFTQGIYGNAELHRLEEDCTNLTGLSILQMNDRKKLSFKDMAKLIRYKLEVQDDAARVRNPA